ncbi:MAG: hypothetical protein KA140_03175 [Caldisericia bacterium]|nr:hypothetical protein [Caldisericia bacterium]
MPEKLSLAYFWANQSATLGLWPNSGGLGDQDALVVLIRCTIHEFALKQMKLRERK